MDTKDILTTIQIFAKYSFGQLNYLKKKKKKKSILYTNITLLQEVISYETLQEY